MLLIDGKLRMSEKEWEDFQAATWAPWRPRTPAEFNAMCDLGAARREAEDLDGMGFLGAIECRQMRFGANGEANFPMDARKLAYCKVHGIWPNEEQLKTFLADEAATPGDGGLKLVKNG